MLYLLHFEKPVSGKSHYLGYTQDGRLEARLSEHMNQRGARLTARAVKANVSIYLARVFDGLTTHEEARVKAASHFKNLCPLCCPLFEQLKHDVRLIREARPDQVPARAIWDARPPVTPLSFPAIEKGGPR